MLLVRILPRPCCFEAVLQLYTLMGPSFFIELIRDVILHLSVIVTSRVPPHLGTDSVAHCSISISTSMSSIVRSQQVFVERRKKKKRKERQKGRKQGWVNGLAMSQSGVGGTGTCSRVLGIQNSCSSLCITVASSVPALQVSGPGSVWPLSSGPASSAGFCRWPVRTSLVPFYSAFSFSSFLLQITLDSIILTKELMKFAPPGSF